jgi:hypothetical protein
MISAPLGENDDEFQMVKTPEGFRFTSDHEKIHAVVTVKRNFVIDAMEAKTPEFEALSTRTSYNRKEGSF